MQKSPDAFRTISEVAEDLDVPQHVLRFWETRFAAIRPLKRGGGRRYYRPDDVDLLKGIRQLLYGQGYTIKGVQRILREDGLRFVQALGRGEQAPLPARPDPADEDDDGDIESGPEPAIGHSTLPDDDDADERRLAGGAPGRLPGGIIPDLGSAPGTGLAGDDLARVRLALDELLECERILGTLQAD